MFYIRWLVVVVLLSQPVFAQMDSVIFVKEFVGGTCDGQNANTAIIGLGDQNDDGYDDFALLEIENKRIYVYYGGDPLDTLVDLSIPISVDEIIWNFIPFDLNHDSYKDIILIFADRIYEDDGSYASYRSAYYYCGPLLDTLYDGTFPRPDSASLGFGIRYIITEDFNNDGNEELWLYDYYAPNDYVDFRNHDIQWGCWYVYGNSGNEFSFTPDNAIIENRDDSMKVSGVLGSGDINGDGYTDLMLTEFKQNVPWGDKNLYKKIYLGNPDFELNADTTFFDQHLNYFFPDYFNLIPDMNQDGHAEILSFDLWLTYPPDYKAALIYGEWPIVIQPSTPINALGNYFRAHGNHFIIDVNGDGYNELIDELGSSLAIFYGGNPPPRAPKVRYYKEDKNTSLKIFNTVGDVNGDGLDDLAIGDSHIHNQTPSPNHPSIVYIVQGDTSFRQDPPLAVKDTDDIKTEETITLQTYPNPTNASISVEYNLNTEGNVAITMFDVTGSEVATYTEGYKQEGTHTFHIETNSFSSGIYFLKLVHNQGGITNTQTNKIVIQK